MPLSVLNPHSPQSQIIASLFTVILILSVIVFLIVCGLVAWSLLRYRARAGAAEPAPNFGSRALEITWTVIPLVVVIAIFIVSVRAMALIDAPRTPGKADIVITGHQWWWDARYPNGAIVAGEIHIPASRRLVARIDSADVIHDFWAPQLGRKMDAVPGLASYIWLEADQPGTYQGVCSEFCGAQHAWMHFLVIAQPETDFSVWLNHQAEPARTPVTALETEGARLYRQKKCGDCHAAPDKGPDLTHVAGREFLGGGVSRNTPRNLALWIAKPQSIKPGNRMPDQPLSSAEIEALTAYLGSLL
jgi:cytochrome c oxidase subunit II